MAKLKAETDALRARGEAFSRRLEEWFSSEGLKSLERKAREEIPRVAAAALHPEIEAFKMEMEKIQAQGEELNRRARSWFESEGKEVLEKVARELFRRWPRESSARKSSGLRKKAGRQKRNKDGFVKSPSVLRGAGLRFNPAPFDRSF